MWEDGHEGNEAWTCIIFLKGTNRNEKLKGKGGGLRGVFGGES